MIHEMLTAGWIDTVRGLLMIVVMFGIVVWCMIEEFKHRGGK